MLLKTFLKRLCFQPLEIRHDHYDNKDILTFEKKDGFFPYVEFQSTPVDKQQDIYFDVLNWEPYTEKYMSNCDLKSAAGFTKIYKLNAENTFSVIDGINERLQAFYMIFDSKHQHQNASD